MHLVLQVRRTHRLSLEWPSVEQKVLYSVKEGGLQMCCQWPIKGGLGTQELTQ